MICLMRIFAVSFQRITKTLFGQRRPTLIRLCGCPDWSESRDVNQVIFLFLLYHVANLTSPITHGHGSVGYYMYMYWFSYYICNFLALIVMRSRLRNTLSVNYQTKKYSRIKIFLFFFKGLYSRTVLSTTNNQQFLLHDPSYFLDAWLSCLFSRGFLPVWPIKWGVFWNNEPIFTLEKYSWLSLKGYLVEVLKSCFVKKKLSTFVLPLIFSWRLIRFSCGFLPIWLIKRKKTVRQYLE